MLQHFSCLLHNGATKRPWKAPTLHTSYKLRNWSYFIKGFILHEATRKKKLASKCVLTSPHCLCSHFVYLHDVSPLLSGLTIRVRSFLLIGHFSDLNLAC